MQNGKKLIFQKLRAKAASDNKAMANSVLSVMMQQKYGSSAMSKESALKAQHTIEKQAFMGALLKALGSARSAAGAVPGALKTYGKRMMGDSTLKPLQQRADLIEDLGYTMFQPPWIDDARSIGNPDSIAKLRNTWQHGVMNGPHGRPSWPPRGLNFGLPNDPVHRNLEDTAYKYLERHHEDALRAIPKEHAAINMARELTTAAAGGSLAAGAAGLGAHHAMNKESGALGRAAALMALYPTEKQAFLNALLQGGKLALQGGKLAAKGIGSGISASLPYVQSGIKGVGNALSSYGGALSGQAAGAARKALPGLEQAANNAWSQGKKLGPGGAGHKFMEQVYNPARQAFTNGQALTQNLEFNRNLARGLTGAGAAGVGGAMALKSGFDDNKKDTQSKAAAYKSAVYPPSVATQNWTARVAAHDRAMAAKQKGTAKEITPYSETSSDAASFLPKPMRPMPKPMTRPLPVRKSVSAIQSGSETSPDAASFLQKSSASAQLGKAAALTEGLVAGVPMGLAGAGAGLGVGGLYGLLSGAYEAKKGKKIRGALGGLLRGAGGGALVGGGIGAGAGAGLGFMMPNVLSSNPMMQALHATNLAINPIGNAANMAAGGIAGSVIGGRLANSARKKLQDRKSTDSKKEDDDESEENTNDRFNSSASAQLGKAAALAIRFKLAGEMGEVSQAGNAVANSPNSRPGLNTGSMRGGVLTGVNGQAQTLSPRQQENVDAATQMGNDFTGMNPGAGGAGRGGPRMKPLDIAGGDGRGGPRMQPSSGGLYAPRMPPLDIAGGDGRMFERSTHGPRMKPLDIAGGDGRGGPRAPITSNSPDGVSTQSVPSNMQRRYYQYGKLITQPMPITSNSPDGKLRTQPQSVPFKMPTLPSGRTSSPDFPAE